MATAAAIAIYNFVNAAILTISTNAVLASNLAHLAVSAAKAVLLATISAITTAATANKPKPQGTLITLDLAPDAPRRVVIGTRGNAGVMADWYSEGHKNQFAYIPIYLCEGPCGPLTGIWASGRKVWTGSLAHGQRIQLTQFDSPSGRAWVTYHDGRPGQVADANLVGKGLGWGSTAVGTGCAYVIVELKWDPNTVPGIIPFYFEIAGGSWAYDRRKDSTAGGSGSHRLKEPMTWEPSTNPAVHLDHFKQGRFLGSSDVDPVFGIGMSPSDAPYDRFAALANVNDEAVPLQAGGTQKRYEANGFLFSDRMHKDTILDLCRAMNARPADFGGLVSEISGEARTPVITLTEDDLIEGVVETYKPKKTRSDLVQAVRGSYVDAGSNFASVEYPLISDAAWRAQDGGEVEPETVDFEMETSVERAQRLAWLHAKRKRRQASLTSVFGLKAMILQEGDWFVRSGGKFGAGKTFEVYGSPALDPNTFAVTISAIEVDPADVAWDSGIVTIPAPLPGGTPTPPRLPVPSVSVVAVAYSIGVIQMPVVRFTNNDAADGAPTAVEIEVADNDGGGAPTGERVPHFIPLGQSTSILTGLLPAKSYVARWRAVMGGNSSLWSAWSTFVTTTQLTAGGADWSGITGVGRPADFADVTGVNIALGFSGEGVLARLDDVDWGTLVVGAGRPANNATVGATWGVNVGGSNLPADNADVTGANVALGFTGEGALARLNLLDWSTYVVGAGRPANNATVGATWGVNIGGSNLPANNADVTASNLSVGFIGEGALARLSVVDWQTLVVGANRPANNATLGATWGVNIGGSNLPANNADVTGANIALGFTGEGALARLNQINWQTHVGGTGVPEDNADVTATSVPTLGVSASSAVFTADYTGALDVGQAPRIIGCTRKLGSTDVSASTAWSIVALTGCTATIDNSASASGGTLTVTAVSNSGSITVRSVRDGVTLETSIAITKTLSPPPPPPSGSAGTLVQDSSFASVSGTSLVAISDEMTVTTGPSGQIAFNAPLTCTPNFGAPAGVFEVALRWRIKPVGGSYSYVSAESASAPDPYTVFESEFGSYLGHFGSVNSSPTDTGLSASTDYVVQLMARRTGSSPAKTVSFIGTASAQGS